MRKLVLSMVVSVDGFINGPGGEFIGPDWSADLDRWTDDMVARFDTLVYGRTSWEKMAEFWPPAGRNPDLPEATRRLAAFMNGSRKLVFSRTLGAVDGWKNSVLAEGEIGAVIGAEKARDGKDLVLFAGAVTGQAALAAGVVDELWLLTIPRLFGHGTRLFDGNPLKAGLRLIEAREMDTGAVLTRYDIV